MSAFNKDIFREIKNTAGRFISLLILTALGAASVVGIQAAALDMRNAADKLYKKSRLYDIQIKSTIGFDDGDVEVMRNADGVKEIFPTYIIDALTMTSEEEHAVRTYAVPDKINNVELLSGRLPDSEYECAVEQLLLEEGGYELGDTIELFLNEEDDITDYISRREFTITGVVSSPLYLTFRRGNTSLGNGTVTYYMYLHPDAYTVDVYTDLYVIMDGSENMEQLTEEYAKSADSWAVSLKSAGEERIISAREKFADAQREIDDGWAEYYDGLDEMDREMSDARAELADAKSALDEALTELENGQKRLDREMADARREINVKQEELENAQREIDNRVLEITEGRAAVSEARMQLETGLSQLEARAPRGFSDELDASYDEIDAGLREVERRESELEYAYTVIGNAQIEINSGENQISEALDTLYREQAENQRTIDEGFDEYYDGFAEYNDGLNKLREEESTAHNKLSDAKKELEDAQNDLDSAPEPEWFFLTRKDGVSFDSYEQDTYRLQKIGYVFPIVFFLVAILVTLTTMSRMIEEHRTQIGVYKALGYRSGAIMAKYLIYAFSASIAGGVAGVIIGSILFPIIISDAYTHLYYVPPIETPVPGIIAFVAVAAAALSVVGITLIACASTLTDSPALLMRPKAPPSGKRVLLERVTFIWKRLSFTGKVTARNIFRYKKRFIMTLAGIAGCSALLVTAFGLRDSIAAVSLLQYGELTLYETRVYTKELKNEEQQQSLSEIIPDDALFIREEAVEVSNKTAVIQASLIVPDDASALNDHLLLNSTETKLPVTLTNDGVIITEKMAEMAGVKKGGDIIFTAGDGDEYTVKVTEIAENYVLHYIYIPQELYEQLFNKNTAYNSVLTHAGDNGGLTENLLKNDNVQALVSVSEMHSNLGASTDALGVVTVVLIALASALAFVVLFNLTNINITERIRELATLKVLGFYDSETSLYIYRENGIVTFMGILAGLVFGNLLHRFVLKTVEIDLLRFPIIVTVPSYIYAVLLSLAFAVIVNLVMDIKLKRIDMVESLKNVE